MLNKGKSAILLFALCWACHVQAKGLDTLNPELKPEPSKELITDKLSPKGGEKKPEDKTEKPEEGAEKKAEAEKKEPQEVSAASLALKDRLTLATSFALAKGKTSQSGRTWQSAGLSDVTVSYLLERKLMAKATKVSFRYAPLAVMLHVKKDGITQEYIGVVENYLAGIELDHDLSEKTKAYGTLEFGLFRQNFAINGDYAFDEPADDQKFGILLVAGGGLDFRLGERFYVGPNAYLGLGSYMLLQIGAKFSFVF